MPDLPSWAVHSFDGWHWTAWFAAVSVAMLSGACLRRWGHAYAAVLASGADATAGALWGAFWSVARGRGGGRFSLFRDGVLALSLGILVACALLAWGLAALGFLVLGLPLAALAWIDARSGLLPDALTLPVMVAGWAWGPLPLAAASSASALVWAGLASVAGAYRWARGRDGLGGGDIKYLAALAAWLDVAPTLAVLWLACVLGGLAWLCLARVRRRGACAFGPCLTLSAFLVLGFGAGPFVVPGLSPG